MKQALRQTNLLPCTIILICVIFAVTASPATAGGGSHCPCFNSGLIFGMSHIYLELGCSDELNDAYVAMFHTDREGADEFHHAAYETWYDEDNGYYCGRVSMGFPRPGTDHEETQISDDEYEQCYDAIVKAIDRIGIICEGR
jgi:hypothetical protein